MRRPVAAIAAATCLSALAGCGSAATPSSSLSDREWAANANGVIGTLQRDLDLSTSGGSTIAAARRALHDDSTIYTILVAYTDFAGCAHMVASTGAPPPKFVKADDALHRACATFERAAGLFDRATKSSNAHRLLEATLTALKGSPPLEQAAQDLQAAMATRKS